MDLSKFTIVTYDLPGFGKSTIIEGFTTDPTLEYFKVAAQVGSKLMSELGFKTYSLGGWSDGARVACLLAAECQSRVNTLLLWSFLPAIDTESSWAFSRTRDIGTWNPEALEIYSSVYGEQEFSEKWRKYVDYLVSTLEQSERLDLKHNLSAIKCPTLILHGSRDPIVKFQEHVEPLEKLIYDSNIKQIKGLAHNIHQADPKQFNRVLTDFVTCTGVC